MCGIIGYIGADKAVPILINGLKKLEYRGYDSAGVAVINDEKSLIDLVKTEGRIVNLENEVISLNGLNGSVGIGHTRWATHGKPSKINAHPHLSQSEKFAIVHNGIIENYVDIKNKLTEEGYNFNSETDTEVVAHLLDYNYSGNFLDSVYKTISELKGSFALCMVSLFEPDKIICVKKASPLIIATSESGNYIASDVTAILNYSKRIYKMNDNEVAVVSPEKVCLYDENQNEISIDFMDVDLEVDAADKCGYDHFMLKEIHEQSRILREILKSFTNSDKQLDFSGIGLNDEKIRNLKKINFVACGSAYHVGVIGKYVIEELLRIPVETDIASEFRYRNPIVDENSLTIIISQSGETADSLEAAKEANKKGSYTLSIVNVEGSSIATECKNVIYTKAGPEISVATTKAYTAQLMIVYLLGLYIGKIKEILAPEKISYFVEKLREIPNKIEEIFEQEEKLSKIADNFKALEHSYFIGRNLDYAVALEASLKLKEISYIHSEAYAAGELKHGTISLIEKDTMVIALCCSENLIDKTISNAKEVITRGAKILCVTQEKNKFCDEFSDFIIYIPETDPLLIPFMEVVPLQLLGYYTATARNCDVDNPRNLAKSVTVE